MCVCILYFTLFKDLKKNVLSWRVWRQNWKSCTPCHKNSIQQKLNMRKRISQWKQILNRSRKVTKCDFYYVGYVCLVITVLNSAQNSKKFQEIKKNNVENTDTLLKSIDLELKSVIMNCFFNLQHQFPSPPLHP